MNKADRTRQYIIEKTAVIFNTKGYSGTSLTDMTTATGLSKGSIYGNFANKDEVAVAVYEYNIKALRRKLDLAVDAEDTATDKLFAVIAYYRKSWGEEFAKGGCPMLNAAVEADDNLPFLKKKVKRSIEDWAQKLYFIIEDGQAKGEFKKEANAAEYAYTMIALIEGGIMLGKITDDEKHLFLALERVERIVKEEIIR